MQENRNLSVILADTGLARLGDSLLNFAFSVALTEKLGHPTGTKVSDKTLAEAAVKAGLRKHLPRRIGRGEVANSIEALLGFIWLEKMITLEEILGCLRTDTVSPAQNFAELAVLALARLQK